ncbi:MAG: response regulator, partial [Planctomycetota bacterium]
KITVDVKGEILQLKNTINTMVDQLGSFASEVTRVAREVGTEGKLGGQATVKGVDGTWKDLTDNVNIMASNLTAQVRGIARVVTAVARGDLKRQLTLEAKGEIADLAETINSMIETLGTFGDQVTSVAREVGIEGRLGGQANVPGAAGLWRDLTDNVNRLAGNLTTQVRAIAEVATAVTKGDLTRAITVEASGEVASLKDNINMMIANLRETTRQNTEQDWLKSNLARLTRTLQGQRDPLTVARMMLSELAPLAGAQHAVFYIIDESEHDTGRDGKDGKDGKEPRDADRMYRLLASYAFNERKTLSTRFRAGEGLIGQCALEKQRIMLSNVPQDYIRVTSGLGDATPSCIVVVPVLFEGQVRAVIEMASFTVLNSVQLALLEQVTESLGVMLNTIDATQRTESLLKQSQALTEELRTQQSELTATNQRLQTQARELKQSEDLLRAQQTELESANEQLEERTRLLSSQKAEVERKNTEVEQARQMLEEKARQLALTSRYKSEFLANMSHELRTPLNSLLILSEMLATNADANLSPKEIEFARTIHTSGSDLLEMINDILDLAKIESGKATVDVEDVPFDQIETFVERTFRQVAQKRGLAFRIDIADNLPAAIRTDSKRLQQVLKNLLSNAFKFTEHGSVRLSIHPANDLDVLGEETRSNADAVIAFAVTDTGVGIPADKHRLIFEAFQQADAGTARKFGGTGLGLSITREVVAMLGGQIVLRSEPGEGSTFTVYLPVGWRMPANASSNGGAAVPVAVMHHPHWSVEEDSQTFDDTTDAGPDDRVILIIEDDPDFARLLSDLAHERGFCCLVASTAEEGLNLARTRCPAAITLDIRLPDGDGWVVLDQLKRDRDTAHIPVHVISAVEDLEPGAKRGALAVLQKPVTREALTAAIASLHEAVDDQRRLLVFDDDTTRREEIVELIAGNDVELMIARNETEAISALQKGTCDCVVLGIGRYADAMSVRRIRSHPGLRQVPIVIYANGDTANDDESTEMLGTPVIVDVKSPERLLDEAALFLHSVEANLPAAKRRMLEAARRNDPDLAGKTVLLVDDDTRNIFALSSVLERFGICVLRAGSGREAIETLQNTAGIDAVLMDIMMPEMDGYEAMQVIRGFDEYRKLPIIALTAKAMKGDREKCIEAGATDYLAKPVDVGQLLSLLRVWMHR